MSRMLDIVLAVAALLLLLPGLLVVAVLIRLDSKGPALFRQVRLGVDQRPFTFYKFRTMRATGSDAEHRMQIAREVAGEDMSSRGSWKLDGDPRITRIGGVLRATSVDELPQLINVVRGQMAMVGPRPCLPWEAAIFPEEFGERFSVRPGITGLWQVSGRSTLGTLDMLRLDRDYVRSHNIRGDLAILVRTVPAVLKGDGAR